MKLHRRNRRTDPRWQVAASIRVVSADRQTVNRLVREVDTDAGERELDGVVIGRRHPTGWFIHAVRRDDLAGEDLDSFRDLVTVRSYLLLRQGPVPPLWKPAPGAHEWRSAADSSAADLAGIVRDLGR